MEDIEIVVVSAKLKFTNVGKNPIHVAISQPDGRPGKATIVDPGDHIMLPNGIRVIMRGLDTKE